MHSVASCFKHGYSKQRPDRHTDRWLPSRVRVISSKNWWCNKQSASKVPSQTGANVVSSKGGPYSRYSQFKVSLIISKFVKIHRSFSHCFAHSLSVVWFFVQISDTVNIFSHFQYCTLFLRVICLRVSLRVSHSKVLVTNLCVVLGYHHHNNPSMSMGGRHLEPSTFV